MTEYEKAEQDVAAAKVAERIAEWKAMEAKAAYYRYAGEAMAASAEVMGARIRRDNALASEFVEKAQAAALSVPEVAEVEIPEGSAQQEKLSRLEDVRTAAKTLLANASGHYINAEDRYVLESALDMIEDSDVPEGYKPWPPQETLSPDAMIEYWWSEGETFRAKADQTIISDPPRAYRVLPIEPAAEAKGEDAEPCPVTFDADTPEDERKAIAEGWNAAKRGVARDVSHMREDLKRAWLFGYDAADDPTGIRAEWDVPDTITIASSSQHAEESARAQSLPPLFKPEPPQAATPEELMESGAINGEAYGLWRKLAKVEA